MKTPHKKAVNELPLSQQFIKAKNYTQWLVTRNPQTTGTLKTKLNGRGYTPEVIEGVTEWAQEYNLINDVHYAESYIREYAVRGDKNISWVKKKLYSKGITSEVFETAFEGVQQETNVFSLEGREEKLTHIAEKLYRQLSRQNLDNAKARQKFTRRTLQLGYTYEEINWMWRWLEGNVIKTAT